MVEYKVCLSPPSLPMCNLIRRIRASEPLFLNKAKLSVSPDVKKSKCPSSIHWKKKQSSSPSFSAFCLNGPNFFHLFFYLFFSFSYLFYVSSQYGGYWLLWRSPASRLLFVYKRIVIEPKFLLKTNGGHVSRSYPCAASFRCNRTLFTWFCDDFADFFFLLLFFPFCSPIFFHLFPEKNYLSPHFFNLSSVYPHTTKKNTNSWICSSFVELFVTPLFIWLSIHFHVISLFFNGSFWGPTNR